MYHEWSSSGEYWRSLGTQLEATAKFRVTEQDLGIEIVQVFGISDVWLILFAKKSASVKIF